MDDGDSLFFAGAILALCCAVLALIRRVNSLEEDMELATVPAAGSGTLLDAKRAIEKRAVERAEARGKRR